MLRAGGKEAGSAEAALLVWPFNKAKQGMLRLWLLVALTPLSTLCLSHIATNVPTPAYSVGRLCPFHALTTARIFVGKSGECGSSDLAGVALACGRLAICKLLPE